MHRTLAALADGRELIYYDAVPGAARDQIDHRQVDPPAGASQLRYDALTGDWIAVASHRQARTHLPATRDCPLCPSGPGRLTEIPAPSYEVAVFENRFPALAAKSETFGPHPEPSPHGGRCEVICFSDQHTGSFGTMTPARAHLVLAALADRTRELSAKDGIAHVACFENRGEQIGQTLPHPHGQIFAFPYLPPRVTAMLDCARAHHDTTGRHLHADLLAAEIDDRVRVVQRNEHWTCYVPLAARWPIEAHVVPHRQAPDLAALTDEELAAGAALVLDLLRRADALYGFDLPYIAAWHQAPSRHPDRELLRVHLQLTSPQRTADKWKYLAGAESAMGAFISDRTPEQTATMLREAG